VSILALILEAQPEQLEREVRWMGFWVETPFADGEREIFFMSQLYTFKESKIAKKCVN
jgi:hypothetical protein